jgi:hypothetical protein
MQRPSPTWIAFLAMAFAIVGLTGIFATYGAPLPLQRALARDATLDAAAAAAHGPDPAAALDALRDRLGDSADAILPLGANFDEKITRERVAMHARFLADEAATAAQLRMLIIVVTVMGAVFGAVLLNVGQRRDPGSRGSDAG